ncbi:hypothetical protein E2R51_17070 [Jeotgalibacillus sp. S-D1]|uniref:restriction endonuclease subunit S n=1 Tax=Jeotgalibacillus sp. S-D1 TaxID=2552189 RepID=UPI0010598711|nr:restriction endonuclease subunit S [Jeotgalibacillus sp. S-D1]TDL30697.1 hypothetical protein E2R51_17070 [Jeotgalibacillus sp. S-D1]
MVKSKNRKEMLVESIILAEEQPYDIPNNWIWTKLKFLFEINMGQSPKGEFTTEESCYIPLVGGPADMGKDFPMVSRYTKKATKITTKNELIISIRATIGKTNISDGEYCLGRGVAGIKSLNINTKLLRYYIDTIHPYLNTISTGTTFKQISKKNIEDIPFPLPPINEQRRIANKVERLLSKIDEAKQLIEEAKESFELRRAAILDKAFRGELTKKWRVNHNIKNNDITPLNASLSFNIPKNWVVTNFQSIAADEKYSLAIGPFGSNLKVSDYTTEGIPLIFVRNIRSLNYKLEQKFVSVDKAIELKPHVVNSGDVLITKMGDPPGDSDILPDSFGKAIITADCIKFRANNKLVNNRYVMYAIKSPFIQNQIRKQSKGVAQQKITLKIFKELKIPVPVYDEQVKIVEILDKYMKDNECILSDIKITQNTLALLKQSILSKAFRGELGTNDPNEEDAIDLLKQVLQEQVK